jgi:hypothetical protein
MNPLAILKLWPVIKWALQALGFMGPEDREKERDFKLRLMEASEKKDAALIEAWAKFQASRLAFERVYSTLLCAGVAFDVVFGAGISVQRARMLTEAGIGGLVVLSIILFPLYGAALVPGVAAAFSFVVEALKSRKDQENAPTSGPGAPVVTAGPRPAIEADRPVTER